MKPSLLDKVTHTLTTHNMLPEAADVPVVLMVSGGSDSLALAALLPQLCSQVAYTILHVNHQLRGAEADADEKFVLDFARSHALPCEVVRLDIAALADISGDNIEQCGRNERYRAAGELLDQLCEQANIRLQLGRIAVAHTLDDRVETFFMRAIVGGGASGLSSIPYRNGRVIRPLLDCQRQELREYLLERRDTAEVPPPPWREDASNYDTRGFRAFVRHELLPLAATRNPLLLETVGRSLQLLSDEDDYLEAQVKQLEAQLVREETGGLLLVDGAVFSQPLPLLRRLIRNACNRVLPAGERITFGHVSRITDTGQRVGFITTLPGNVTVKNEYGTLAFHPVAAELATECAPSVAQAEVCLWLTPGEPLELPDGSVLKLWGLTQADFADDALTYARAQAGDQRVFVDGAALSAALEREGGHLLVTGIQTGDVFCPLGMGGRHKLVSDVLIDRKIPARLRPQLKVLRAGQDIVWIVGVQLDERFKVTPESNTMFRIDMTATRG
jgi:tRNA(Ile)-lysidine synthase